MACTTARNASILSRLSTISIRIGRSCDNTNSIRWIRLDSPNPAMPRRAVTPAIAISRARSTMASTSGLPSTESLAPIWMRNRIASPGICIGTSRARLRLRGLPSGNEIEPQPGLGPFHRGELTRRGQRDVGGAQVGAAKADIGWVDIRHLDLAHHLTHRRNHRDVAGDQGRDADIAGRLDRQTVEALEPRQ